jgi:hypothetical protein
VREEMTQFKIPIPKGKCSKHYLQFQNVEKMETSNKDLDRAKDEMGIHL